jgi:hypothetical protein
MLIFRVVVGFDIEFLKDKTVSTIQFSVKSLACVVHALSIWNNDKKLPRSLKNFLEDANILKVGVGVGSDALKIKKSFDLDTLGLVDIAVMSMKLGLSHGKSLYLVYNRHRIPSIASTCTDYR